MRKRYISFILICLILMTLVSACGQKAEPAPPADASSDQGNPQPEEPAETQDPAPAPEDETQDVEPVEEDPAQVDESSSTLLDLTGKSMITGQDFTGEYKPLLMMIENSPAARPQSGLIDADVVYETYVEGRLTRFFAVFATKDREKAGPVRSTRKYFLDLVREWDSLLVHYGGSKFAKAVYENDSSIKRIDGMHRSKPFWRDNSRKAPHNAYVDTPSCRAEINFDPKAHGFQFTSQGYNGSDYKEISIPYDTKYTLTSYKFDEKTRTHLRYINGKPHVDRETGEQIRATNIIVQYAKHTSTTASSGNIFIDFVSSGKAEYFIDGKHFAGTWEKKSSKDQTLFYDEEGNEIMLMPGNTWIQVVPTDFKIKVS